MTCSSTPLQCPAQANPGECGERFHRKNSLVGGITKEGPTRASESLAEVFNACLDLLVRDKKTDATGDLVRLPATA